VHTYGCPLVLFLSAVHSVLPWSPPHLGHRRQGRVSLVHRSHHQMPPQAQVCITSHHFTRGRSPQASGAVPLQSEIERDSKAEVDYGHRYKRGSSSLRIDIVGCRCHFILIPSTTANDNLVVGRSQPPGRPLTTAPDALQPRRQARQKPRQGVEIKDENRAGMWETTRRQKNGAGARGHTCASGKVRKRCS